MLDVAQVALAGLRERQRPLWRRHSDLGDELAKAGLRLRPREPFARARLALRADPALDLATTDPPLAIPGVAVLMDRAGAVGAPDGATLRLLRTAMLKRAGAQLVTISTAGVGAESPLGRLRMRALGLPSVERSGPLTRSEGPTFAMLEWSVPEDEDVDEPPVVKRANPAGWITEDGLREQREAVHDLAFRQYHCNQWTTSDTTGCRRAPGRPAPATRRSRTASRSGSASTSAAPGRPLRSSLGHRRPAGRVLGLPGQRGRPGGR